MTKPRALRPGSSIRIVSPASPVKPDGVAKGVALLEAQGYKVSFGRHAFDSDGYLAGHDESRLADIRDAYADETVDAVACSRGGYGCSRLLNRLDLDAMAASGKMFVGFSDLTVLHSALNRRGIVTFYAPMLLTFSVDREPWVVTSFLNLLKGEDSLTVDHPKGETLIGGTAQGELSGGCLCLITDSIGTPDEVCFDGKIILIEDVDENPHRVDAMLTHLLNSGRIHGAAGIVVGEMTDTDNRADPKIGAWPWRRIVEDRLGPLNVPTLVNYPFGHMKNMLSLPLGVKVELDADGGRLSLLESPCA